MAPEPSSKAARREAARQEAKALQEAQAKRDRRNRTIVVVAIVAALALIAVTVAVIVGQSSRSLLEDVERPDGSDLSGGIVAGAEGVGEPNEGAPVVRVYSDFLCSFCAAFEGLNGPVLDELREAGSATVVYHPVGYLNSSSNGEYSTRAAQAMAVVADEAQEQFTAFWAALFAVQPASTSIGLSDSEIASVALGVGVPAEVVDTFPDGRFTEWVSAASDQATRDLPRPATPTIIVDGVLFDGDWRDPETLRTAVLEAAA